MIIATGHVNRIIEHCRSDTTNEVCGIVTGRLDDVYEVYPVPSADPSPARFVMEPGEQLRVLNEAQEAGHDLLATFHSHPASPAIPSFVDMQMSWAWDDNVLWFIYSIPDGELRLWRIHSDEAPSMREVKVEPVDFFLI